MWQYFVYSTSAMLVTLVTGTIVLFFTSPKHVLYWALRLNTLRCGMTVKYVGDENFVYCYGERGRKHQTESTILMIHGFTASKDMWLSCFKKLPSALHLIAVDLPGHGSTSSPNIDDNLGMMYQVQHLYKFVKLMGLDDKPFHLIGASLGGAIVGLFAAEYPHLIDRLSLICPAMKTPDHSPFSKTTETAVLNGIEKIDMKDCTLLPLTAAEAQIMLEMVLYHKQSFNKQILKGLVDLRKPKNMYYFNLFKTLATEESSSLLERRAGDIKVPTQIIWGKHDQIIDVSGAKVLETLLPDCRQIDIIERCGHSILLDRPGALMKTMLSFRADGNLTS